MTILTLDPDDRVAQPVPGARTGRAWAPSRELLRNALTAFGIGGALIGLVGFAVSFLSVSDAARPYFGDASWTLPVLVDLGIFTLSGLAVVLELHGISSKLIRLAPNLLALFTVYLNTATQHAWFGKAVHAAGPLLWITVVEIGTFTVRRLVGLSSETTMDKVRTSRWLLAPVSTFRLWRRMRLWEIRDYRDAIGREHAMAASRALLREWHGPRWRRTAPSAQRLAVALQATTTRPVAEILTDAATGILAAQNAATHPAGDRQDTVTDKAENPVTTEPSERPAGVVRRPTGRPKTGQATAKKVVTLARKYPTATIPELAERAGVSVSTVRRALKPQTTPAPTIAPLPQPADTHVNGYDLATAAA
jgi:Protein of unknown function (DUF2637)